MANTKRGKRRSAENTNKKDNGNAIAHSLGPAPAKRLRKLYALNIPTRLTTQGRVLVCGLGDMGQLGLGNDEAYYERSRLTPLNSPTHIVDIAAGGMHNILLTHDGKVYSFGCNDEGALGRNTRAHDSEFKPELVVLPEKAVKISAGDSHSAVILEDGSVYAWGSFRDSHGNLGLTPDGNKRSPIKIFSDEPCADIASGSDHLVILTCTGRVYTIGCAEQGQLARLPMRSISGEGRMGREKLLFPSAANPAKVKHFSHIWATSYCTFMRDARTNFVWAAGLNNYRQLAYNVGKEPQDIVPKPVQTALKDIKQIAGGQHHTLFLNENGTCLVIGRCDYGRLGLGALQEDLTELKPILNLPTNIVRIACGEAQSYAITDDGKLYAWGMGSSYQLGTGHEDDVLLPEQIVSKHSQGKKILLADGGGQHSIFLLEDLDKSEPMQIDEPPPMHIDEPPPMHIDEPPPMQIDEPQQIHMQEEGASGVEMLTLATPVGKESTSDHKKNFPASNPEKYKQNPSINARVKKSKTNGKDQPLTLKNARVAEKPILQVNINVPIAYEHEKKKPSENDSTPENANVNTSTAAEGNGVYANAEIGPSASTKTNDGKNIINVQIKEASTVEDIEAYKGKNVAEFQHKAKFDNKPNVEENTKEKDQLTISKKSKSTVEPILQVNVNAPTNYEHDKTSKSDSTPENAESNSNKAEGTGSDINDQSSSAKYNIKVKNSYTDKIVTELKPEKKYVKQPETSGKSSWAVDSNLNIPSASEHKEQDSSDNGSTSNANHRKGSGNDFNVETGSAEDNIKTQSSVAHDQKASTSEGENVSESKPEKDLANPNDNVNVEEINTSGKAQPETLEKSGWTVELNSNIPGASEYRDEEFSENDSTAEDSSSNANSTEDSGSDTNDEYNSAKDNVKVKDSHKDKNIPECNTEKNNVKQQETSERPGWEMESNLNIPSASEHKEQQSSENDSTSEDSSSNPNSFKDSDSDTNVKTISAKDNIKVKDSYKDKDVPGSSPEKVSVIPSDNVNVEEENANGKAQPETLEKSDWAVDSNLNIPSVSEHKEPEPSENDSTSKDSSANANTTESIGSDTYGEDNTEDNIKKQTSAAHDQKASTSDDNHGFEGNDVPESYPEKDKANPSVVDTNGKERSKTLENTGCTGESDFNAPSASEHEEQASSKNDSTAESGNSNTSSAEGKDTKDGTSPSHVEDSSMDFRSPP